MTDKPVRLKVWHADAEWPDDEMVVKASDYDKLEASRAADKARIAKLEQQHHRDSAELRRLCADRDSFQRVGIQSMAERNELLGLLRDVRDSDAMHRNHPIWRRIDTTLTKHKDTP